MPTSTKSTSSELGGPQRVVPVERPADLQCGYRRRRFRLLQALLHNCQCRRAAPGRPVGQQCGEAAARPAGAFADEHSAYSRWRWRNARARLLYTTQWAAHAVMCGDHGARSLPPRSWSTSSCCTLRSAEPGSPQASPKAMALACVTPCSALRPAAAASGSSRGAQQQQRAAAPTAQLLGWRRQRRRQRQAAVHAAEEGARPGCWCWGCTLDSLRMAAGHNGLLTPTRPLRMQTWTSSCRRIWSGCASGRRRRAAAAHPRRPPPSGSSSSRRPAHRAAVTARWGV